MTFDEIAAQALKLSTVDKLRLIEFLAKSIREELEAQESQADDTLTDEGKPTE